MKFILFQVVNVAYNVGYKIDIIEETVVANIVFFNEMASLRTIFYKKSLTGNFQTRPGEE